MKEWRQDAAARLERAAARRSHGLMVAVIIVCVVATYWLLLAAELPAQAIASGLGFAVAKFGFGHVAAAITITFNWVLPALFAAIVLTCAARVRRAR